MPLIQYAQFDAVLAERTRITEASDTRITEAGDIRITNSQITNQASGTLVASATVIKLESDLYVKDNGLWKTVIPYVNYLGTWQVPNAIYKKVSGNWKRVY